MHQLTLVILDIAGRTSWLIGVYGLPVTILIVFGSIRIAQSTRMGALGLRQKMAAFSSKYDNRPPVLYLRPFSVDGNRTSFTEVDFSRFEFKIPIGRISLRYNHVNYELRLATKAQKLGPFVAIGDPHAKSENYGALRSYYSDDEWKGQILQKMKQSSMIIMRAGSNSHGNVLWEFENMTKSFLQKSIFFLEAHRNTIHLELIKKFGPAYPRLNNLTPDQFPCYVEFPDDNCFSVKRNLAGTNLYRDLYYLSKFNKHHMYCANCGSPNDSQNKHCTECGQDLSVQRITKKKEAFLFAHRFCNR